jgi:hypothetical protein
MADNDNEDIEVEEEHPMAAASGLGPDAVRKLKLVHTLPPTHTSAKSGRNLKKDGKRDGRLTPLPTSDHLEYLARLQEAELRFVDGDDLVRAARNGANATEVIRLTLVRVAQNSASLEFQRIELQKRGEDTSQLVSRSTNVLKEVAALQAQLRELGQQTLDPRSPGFQKVFQLWAGQLQQVVKEVMSPEQADMFYTKFMAMMENWEDQAESVLR